MASLSLVTAGGIPSSNESDERKVKRLRMIFEDARAAKEEATSSWPENWNFYLGHHWSKPRPSWKASPRIPVVFGKTETVIPIMTDSRPRVHVLPRSSRFAEHADAMQKLMDYEWDRQHMDRNMEDNTKNALVCGDGILYPWYDTQRQRPVTDVVPPENIFPDAQATSMEDCRVLMHRTMLARSEILRRWPDADSRRVVPGATFQGRGTEDIGRGASWGGRQGAMTGTLQTGETLIVQDVPGRMDREKQEEIEVLMFLIDDQDTIEVDAYDPQTGQPLDYRGRRIRTEELRYPYGRLVVVAGQEIVFDGPNPYEHGRKPYLKQSCHPIAGRFWSVPFVQNLVPLNKYANKLMGLILDNAALMASAQWKLSKNAQVDPKMLTGEPGLAVVYNSTNGGLVDKIPGVALPSYVMAALELALRLADDTSGVFDVTQGKKPVGITAAVAIEQLQEAGHTRIRLLARHMEDTIADWGRMTLAYHKQFLTEPKVVRVSDPDSGQVQFIPITPEMVREEWDVEVVAGSTLPRSRDARQRMAMELFKEGVIDKADVLKYVEFPGAEDVLRRMRQQEQMQTAMALSGVGQQDQGGGGGGPAPAGPPPGRRPQVSGRGGGFFNQP